MRREWSSMKSRISTSVPSATRRSRPRQRRVSASVCGGGGEIEPPTPHSRLGGSGPPGPTPSSSKYRELERPPASSGPPAPPRRRHNEPSPPRHPPLRGVHDVSRHTVHYVMLLNTAGGATGGGASLR